MERPDGSILALISLDDTPARFLPVGSSWESFTVQSIQTHRLILTRGAQSLSLERGIPTPVELSP